ncbi:MAG: hypothetical protein ACE5H2_00010 [Terriglobia bacterium]
MAFWTTPEGRQREAAGECEVVNAHGGLIRLPTQVVPPAHLHLMQMQTRALQQVRVVSHEAIRGGVTRLAVELSHPSKEFWDLPIHYPEN